MSNKNKQNKKERGKIEKNEFSFTESDPPLGLPIDKVKDIAPNLYKEIVSDKSVHEINEIYDDNYSDDDDDFTPQASNEYDIQELQKKNMEVIPEDYKPRHDSEKDFLEGFEPTAVDFIRRAKTKTEALEVIEYLEKRKEINEQEANDLRKKLENQGLESFGEHKKHGYYFQMAEKHKLESHMKLTKRKDLMYEKYSSNNEQ